jgi:putative restriction endonuclease
MRQDDQLVNTIVRTLLEEHFAPSLHQGILDALGVYLKQDSSIDFAEEVVEKISARRRDFQFRDNVLRAYEYRCAFSGFQVAMGGSYFGCEAAHVKWHSHNGPDSVENGIALEPTMHTLFDIGAWTLTDDHRIMISSHFTGSET